MEIKQALVVPVFEKKHAFLPPSLAHVVIWTISFQLVASHPTAPAIWCSSWQVHKSLGWVIVTRPVPGAHVL